MSHAGEQEILIAILLYIKTWNKPIERGGIVDREILSRFLPSGRSEIETDQRVVYVPVG